MSTGQDDGGESPVGPDGLRDSLAERRARLTDEQRLVLAARLSGRTRTDLSLGQRRLWLVEQLRSGTAELNECFAFLLCGTVSTLCLEAALRGVIARHESLRTSIVDAGGLPEGLVHHDVGFSLDAIDARNLEPGAAQQIADDVAASARLRPFDLTQAPLLRASVVLLPKDRTVLILVNHHVICDAWSRILLLRDLRAFYQASVLEKDVGLPALELQFGDFAAAQHRRAREADLGPALDYWRGQLSGAPSELGILSDMPRPPKRSSRGGRARFQFSGSDLDGIRILARECKTTVFVVALAAIKAMLYRFSGQQDVVVGAPMADRPMPHYADVVGFFVDTVVLRTEVDAGISFADLVGRVRATVLGAMEHRAVPFERLVEELLPVRSMNAAPLFSVIVGMHAVPADVFEIPGVETQLLQLDNETARFDLDFDLADWGSRIDGVCQYSADLLESETVERMLAFVQRFVSNAVRDAHEPVARLLELALETEDDGVLIGPMTPDGTTCRDVIDRFLDSATQNPDEPAVSIDGRTFVTYGALLRRAEAIACSLIGARVDPGSRVGVCVQRGADLVASLIACLWVGATYVPLDPTYPTGRLRIMVENANLEVLLSDGSASDEFARCRRLPLPEVGTGAVSQVSPADPAGLAAYMIYTSGSTGSPKGVVVTRANLANFLGGMDDLLGGGLAVVADARWLATTSMAFDMSIFDLLWPLTHGQQVVIHGSGNRLSGGLSRGGLSAAQAIAGSGVTHLQCTPSFLRMLCDDHDGPAALSCLQVIITGGEALAVDLLARIDGCCAAEVYTCYGPTETTVYSSGERAEASAGKVWLGRPLLNTALYVLDGHGVRVPAGVRGELWIGGAGVAAGYYGAEALTADSFRPDPHGPWGGTQMYRTGDMVSFDGQGRLTFLGRSDQQVKLRGHRIELAEIEHALRAGGARDAAVLFEQGSNGAERLVAHVVASAPDDGVDGFKRHLRNTLPGYMVPERWKLVDALPVTPNGKLDRQAMRAQQPVMPNGSTPLAPATDPTTARMAALWMDVLDIPAPSADADFFELGGHSLLGTRLIARVRDEFSAPVTLLDLLENPSVGELSALVSDRLGGEGDAPAAQPVTMHVDLRHRHEAFPLTDVQQAYWVGRTNLFDLGSVACQLYMEYELDGIDVPRLEKAWNDVVRRHDMLRAIVHPDGQQQILPQVPYYRISNTDERGAPATRGEGLNGQRERMTTQIRPASSWPLFELRASPLPGDRTLLQISIDRLIADAESTRILLGELLTRYRGDTTYEPLTASFRDYVLHERAQQQTPEYERALAYWRRRLPTLAGGPDIGAADTAGLQGARFVRRDASLDSASWASIKSKAAELGATPASILLTLYAEVLAGHCRSPRFALNLTLFDRRPVHPDVADMVGDFTSLLPLEIEDACAGSFEARVARTQRQLWEVLTYREVSGVQIQREQFKSRSKGLNHLPVVFTSELGMGQREIPGTLVRPRYMITQTPQVWLDHMVREEDGELLLTWDAAEPVLPVTMLDEIVESYVARLKSLAMETTTWKAAAVTRNQLAPPGLATLLHHLFDEQMRRTPDAVALRWETGEMTYAALDRRSNAVAAELIAAAPALTEPGPEQIVAIVMRKGWEEIVAVLAIMKAGAAYLPVDASWPPLRIQQVLAQSGAIGVAIQSSVAQPLDLWPLPVVAVGATERANPPELGKADGRHGGSLAYVIYTSGSTGEPKGVMIEHAAALNTVRDVCERFTLGESDAVLAVSGLTFDLSVFDIFGTLGAGATLVLPSVDELGEPADLGRLVRSAGVTVWNSVPALMQMLVAHSEGGTNADLTSLRLVLLSGDWIPVWLPDALRALAPDAAVVSLGGATEASIWSVLYEIGAVDPLWSSIPYGAPMRDQTLYVLDETLAPCAPGAAGELHIGGRGVARGYLGQPGLTADRFIWWGPAGERVYRTGDRARVGADGNMEFLGRADSQVKVGGYRIELGEIEAVLQRHPMVGDAIVTACRTTPDSPGFLRAHVVPSAPASTTRAAPEKPTGSPTALAGASADRLQLKIEERTLRADLEGRPRIPLRPNWDGRSTGKRARTSARMFRNEQLPFNQVSDILAGIVARPGDGIRTYPWPAAGGLYAVQVYLWVREGAVDGIAGGSYFFDPVERAIVPVALGSELPAEVFGEQNRQLFDESALSIYLVSRPDAIEPIYPETWERFVVLEAGAMMQLLVDQAAACGLGACPIGDVYGPPLRAILGLDDEQGFLTAVFVGALECSGPSVQGSLSLSDELREYLAQRLPQYMVPRHICLHEAFPLSANGKVDRAALTGKACLANEPGRSTSGRPELDSSVEVAVLRVWRELLGSPLLAPDANLFDYGADSMHLVRAQRRLHEETGYELRVAEFLEAPTVRQLAAIIYQGLARIAPMDDRLVVSHEASPAKALPAAAERSPEGRLTVQTEPLIATYAAGQLPPVRGVALGYVPHELLNDPAFRSGGGITGWFGDGPVFSSMLTTAYGAIATVTLPFGGQELYDDQERLLESIDLAMEMAQELGARTVSLTGLLASATDYGRAIAARATSQQWPALTTGHATTAASVVMAIERALVLSGRELKNETLAVVGVGSIGAAGLELLLAASGEMPARVVVADVQGKETELRAFASHLERTYELNDRVAVAVSQASLRDEVYEGSLMLGATNYPEIIDVARLQPGAILIDDSYPHCFDVEAAFDRVHRSGDLLFSVAGLLLAPTPIGEIRYLPEGLLHSVGDDVRQQLRRRDRDILTSCTFASLLCDDSYGLPLTIGHVDLEAALAHYRRIAQLAFVSPSPRCNGRAFTDSQLGAFRSEFGTR